MKVFNKIIFTILLVTVISNISCNTRFVMSFFSDGSSESLNVNSLNEDRFGERWEEPGQLTSIGIRQHYLIGQRNRERIVNNNLLKNPNVYDPREVLVKAMVFNSTLMSAEA